MSSPYREPGAVSDAHAKYPRIVIADETTRLVQIADGVFIIEMASTDSMGTAAWSIKARLARAVGDLAASAGMAIVARNNDSALALVWLCEQLAKVTS